MKPIAYIVLSLSLFSMQAHSKLTNLDVVFQSAGLSRSELSSISSPVLFVVSKTVQEKTWVQIGIVERVKTLAYDEESEDAQEIISEWFEGEFCSLNRASFVNSKTKKNTFGVMKLPKGAIDALKKRNDADSVLGVFDDYDPTWVSSSISTQLRSTAIHEVMGVVSEQPCNDTEWKAPLHFFKVHHLLQLVVPKRLVPTLTLRVKSTVQNQPDLIAQLTTMMWKVATWTVYDSWSKTILKSLLNQIERGEKKLKQGHQSTLTQGTLNWNSGMTWTPSRKSDCVVAVSNTLFYELALTLLSYKLFEVSQISMFEKNNDVIPSTISCGLHPKNTGSYRVLHMSSSPKPIGTLGLATFTMVEKIPDLVTLIKINAPLSQTLNLPAPVSLGKTGVLPKAISIQEQTAFMWIQPTSSEVKERTLHVYGQSHSGTQSIDLGSVCSLEKEAQQFPVMTFLKVDTVRSFVIVNCDEKQSFMILDLKSKKPLACGKKGGTSIFYLATSVNKDGNITAQIQCEKPDNHSLDSIRQINSQDEQVFIGSGGGVYYLWDLQAHLAKGDSGEFIDVSKAKLPSTTFKRFGPTYAQNPYNAFAGWGYRDFPLNPMMQYFLNAPKGTGPFLGEVQAIQTVGASWMAIESPCSLCTAHVQRSMVHRLDGGDAKKNIFQLMPNTSAHAEFMSIRDHKTQWIHHITQNKTLYRSHRFKNPLSDNRCDWGSVKTNALCERLYKLYSKDGYVALAPHDSKNIHSQYGALLLASDDLKKLMSESCASKPTQHAVNLWRVMDFVQYANHNDPCLSQERVEAYRTLVRYLGEGIKQNIGLPVTAVASSDSLFWKTALLSKQDATWLFGEQAKHPNQKLWWGIKWPKTGHKTYTKSSLQYAVDQRGQGFSPTFYMIATQQGPKVYSAKSFLNSSTLSDKKTGSVAWTEYSHAQTSQHFVVPESQSTWYTRIKPHSSVDTLMDQWHPSELKALGGWPRGKARAYVLWQLLKGLNRSDVPAAYEPDKAGFWSQLKASVKNVLWWPGRHQETHLGSILESYFKSIIYDDGGSYVSIEKTETALSGKPLSTIWDFLSTPLRLKAHEVSVNLPDPFRLALARQSWTLDLGIREKSEIKPSIKKIKFDKTTNYVIESKKFRNLDSETQSIATFYEDQGNVSLGMAYLKLSNPMKLMWSDGKVSSSTVFAKHMITGLPLHLAYVGGKLTRQANQFIGWMTFKDVNTGKHKSIILGKGKTVWHSSVLDGRVHQVRLGFEHIQVCQKSGISLGHLGNQLDVPLLIVRETGTTLSTEAAPLSSVIKQKDFDKAKEDYLCGGDHVASYLGRD